MARAIRAAAMISRFRVRCDGAEAGWGWAGAFKFFSLRSFFGCDRIVSLNPGEAFAAFAAVLGELGGKSIPFTGGPCYPYELL